MIGCQYSSDQLCHHRISLKSSDYEESIETIKRFDPILAFRLSGRTEIIDYLNNISDIIDGVNLDEQGNEFNHKLIKKLSPKYRKEIIDAFEKHILDVVFQVDLHTWWRTRKRLSKDSSKEDDKKHEEIFNHHLF